MYPQYGQSQYGQQPQHTPYMSAGQPSAGGPFDGAVDPNDLRRPLYGASIGQAIARFFKNYATFSGRASRSEFWWVTLAAFVLSIALSIAIAVAESAMYYASGAYELLTGLVGLLYFAIWVGTFIPWLAISWRRLHDAGLAGPLFFIIFIPFFGPLALLILFILPSKEEGRRFVSTR